MNDHRIRHLPVVETGGIHGEKWLHNFGHGDTWANPFETSFFAATRFSRESTARAHAIFVPLLEECGQYCEVSMTRINSLRRRGQTLTIVEGASIIASSAATRS